MPKLNAESSQKVEIGQGEIMPITFTCSVDDGHPSDIRMAELLYRHGLNATFFIPVRNKEGYPVMPAAQIREVADVFEIGSHTFDHCYLPSVNLPQARYQIFEGKRKLEDMLGKSVSGFCYPGGKYHQAHIDLVKRAHFSYARTTTNLCFDTGASRFEIPTTCQFYPHQKSVYVRNFIRGMHWNQRKAGLFAVLEEDNWKNRIYRLFDHAIQSDSVFHLWLHSHNIDDLNLWSDLDAFLAHVSANVESRQRLNNVQLATRFFQ